MVEFKHVHLYVSYRRVRGKLRQFYNVRIIPLETDRFRFGLPVAGKTLSRAKAERYAADVDAYLTSWLACLEADQ